MIRIRVHTSVQLITYDVKIKHKVTYIHKINVLRVLSDCQEP
jgi:hypothetical protein